MANLYANDGFRSAVKDLVDVVLEHYDDIENRDMKSTQEQTFIKNLIHSANGRKAAYPFFDKKYYKYPSELLKSTITTAIGIVKSYKELTKQWEANGRKGKAPRLNRNQDVHVFSTVICLKEFWMKMEIRISMKKAILNTNARSSCMSRMTGSG